MGNLDENLTSGPALELYAKTLPALQNLTRVKAEMGRWLEDFFWHDRWLGIQQLANLFRHSTRTQQAAMQLSMKCLAGESYRFWYQDYRKQPKLIFII